MWSFSQIFAICLYVKVADFHNLYALGFKVMRLFVGTRCCYYFVFSEKWIKARDPGAISEKHVFYKNKFLGDVLIYSGTKIPVTFVGPSSFSDFVFFFTF